MAVNFEDNLEERTSICISDKYVNKFFINYIRGSAAPYEFSTEAGPTPQELSGRYTCMDRAKQAFLKYEAGAKETKRKEIEKRYASKQAEQDS